MVALHLAPKLLLRWARQRRRARSGSGGSGGGLAAAPEQQQQQQQQRQLEEPAVGGAACKPKHLADGSRSSEDATRDGAAPEAGATHTHARPPASQQRQEQQQEQQGERASEPHGPRLAAARSTVRAPVPLLRGLTRRFDDWEGARPVLRRRLAMAAITLSFMGTCSLQILAPGFVDVSIGARRWTPLGLARSRRLAQMPLPATACHCPPLHATARCCCRHAAGACLHPPAQLPPLRPPLAVQLTTQWTTLGIALAQALLLRHRLPAAFWPCAAAMLG